MHVEDNFVQKLTVLVHTAAERVLVRDDFADVCEALGVSKMYYDMDLGGEHRYRDPRSGRLVVADDEREDKIYLYDNGRRTNLLLKYTYYYDDLEYVHAYIEFQEGICREDVDQELCQFMADVIYLLVSRQNIRMMLDFAETTDAQTGIPNVVRIHNKYREALERFPAEELLVLRINLQNFKYVNEVIGAQGGDEALVRYAGVLAKSVTDEECVCRMGGDNFAMFIKKEHFDGLMDKLESVSVENLKSAPNQSFELTPWIGISEGKPGDRRPFGARLEEASAACDLGKRTLKKNVVVFSDQIRERMTRGHEIIALFHPAVRNREFHPFFQAKVDMTTGKLVGFEALCRWIHEGQFIYPDQFIPVLDREGLIHELDMAIFRETCHAIRTWKDMGLNPPRVSSNFSRKNLFIPDIEQRIYWVLQDFGLDASDVEIEITESVKESEYNRLIDFVKKLKQYGFHISVDDFGTGYSSMALIHNIDADVIKIDKSFVDKVPGNAKSEVLIESIISIAGRLNMSIIAEGVETREQGKALMRLGCRYAQGYYYSKPVDFETATGLIQNAPFEAIR